MTGEIFTVKKLISYEKIIIPKGEIILLYLEIQEHNRNYKFYIG